MVNVATLRIMGSQVTGADAKEPCHAVSNPSFLEGPMILRVYIPIESMYGIFAHFYHKNQLNVGKSNGIYHTMDPMLFLNHTNLC